MTPRRAGVAAAALAAIAAAPASAFPIPFSADPCPSGFDCYGFKAGPVASIAPDAPPALSAFRVGEAIYGRFQVHDAASDSNAAPSAGDFLIPDGGFQLGGLESGAVLDILGGIEVRVRPDRLTLSSPAPAGPTAPFALDSVAFAFDFEAFPEPDDLGRALSGPPDLFTDVGWLRFRNVSDAATRVSWFDGESASAGMAFAAPSRRVPAPAALPLLLAATAAAVAVAARRGP